MGETRDAAWCSSGLTGAPETPLLGPSDKGLQTRTWVQEFTHKEIPEESQGVGRAPRSCVLVFTREHPRAPPGARERGCAASDAHWSLAGACSGSPSLLGISGQLCWWWGEMGWPERDSECWGQWLWPAWSLCSGDPRPTFRTAHQSPGSHTRVAPQAMSAASGRQSESGGLGSWGSGVMANVTT